jgi:osmotically-inducible protein OsmY
MHKRKIPIYCFASQTNKGNTTMNIRYILLCLLCYTLMAPGLLAQEKMCTDPCLKATVATLFIRSPFLSPFRVDISVRDGVATLQGTVSDPGERDLAEETVWSVDGISAVVNQIQVDPAISAKGRGESPVGCRTSDDALADRLRTQLYWHRPTHGMAVEISVRNGIVTLKGMAADPGQAGLAGLIAQNTCGVSKVVNQITPVTQHRDDG